jgi:hypothetical protein
MHEHYRHPVAVTVNVPEVDARKLYIWHRVIVLPEGTAALIPFLA